MSEAEGLGNRRERRFELTGGKVSEDLWAQFKKSAGEGESVSKKSSQSADFELSRRLSRISMPSRSIPMTSREVITGYINSGMDNAEGEEANVEGRKDNPAP